MVVLLQLGSWAATGPVDFKPRATPWPRASSYHHACLHACRVLLRLRLLTLRLRSGRARCRQIRLQLFLLRVLLLLLLLGLLALLYLPRGRTRGRLRCLLAPSQQRDGHTE